MAEVTLVIQTIQYFSREDPPAPTKLLCPSAAGPGLVAGNEDANIGTINSEAIAASTSQTPLPSGTNVAFYCRYAFSFSPTCTETVTAIIPSQSNYSNTSTSATSFLARPTATPSDGSNSGSTKTLSSGAIAGVAIGVAAFFIAGVAAVVWWVRRRNKGPAAAGDIAPPPPPKGPSLFVGRSIYEAGGHGQKQKQKAVEAMVGGFAELEYYLLDGAGDSELASELAALGYLIKDHVDGGYHEGPLGPEAVVALNVALNDLELPFTDEPARTHLSSLIVNPRTRRVALRSLLANVIFTALDLHNVSARVELSLLPPAVTAFLRSIPASRLKGSSSAGSQSTKALNAWRRLSAYLLHENRQDTLPRPSGIATAETRRMQDALYRVLRHVETGKGRGRLERLIVRCTDFGYALFSHPCQWQFLFRAEHGAHQNAVYSSMVLLPGLERLSGPNGEPYGTRQVVVWPITDENRM